MPDTIPTKEEMAKEVRDIVIQLNRAIRNAAAADVTTKIQQTETSVFGFGSVPHFTVETWARV